MATSDPGARSELKKSPELRRLERKIEHYQNISALAGAIGEIHTPFPNKQDLYVPETQIAVLTQIVESKAEDTLEKLYREWCEYPDHPDYDRKEVARRWDEVEAIQNRLVDEL
jgi:hypothetical protein